jgi:hypothetical protein
MSRRRIQWKSRLIQAEKNVEKLIPMNVKGRGEWRTQGDGGVSPGTGKGHQVSLPMSTKREQWVRQVLASIK